MNHDMHVATGMDSYQAGVDTNAGMNEEKAMSGSEFGGMNQDRSMRVSNGHNFATGANAGMETGMGYGTMAMKGGLGDGMNHAMGNGVGMNDIRKGMGGAMGNGMGGSMGMGMGGGMRNDMGGAMGIGGGMGNGMGGAMGMGMGMGMGGGMGGNMAGVDMRMYMGTIKRSKESNIKDNNSKSKLKTS